MSATVVRLAVAQIREAQQKHDIQDMIVVVERTGDYHLAPKRAFAKAGFDMRVVHPLATKQSGTAHELSTWWIVLLEQLSLFKEGVST